MSTRNGSRFKRTAAAIDIVEKEALMAGSNQHEVVNVKQDGDVPYDGKCILVLSATGNTGKSTFSALLQTMRRAALISVTSAGQDSSQYNAKVDTRFHPALTRDLAVELAHCRDKDLVVDVSGGATENFLVKIISTGFFELFELVILVVDATSRSQEDMLSCLKLLRREGLLDSQIRILLSRGKAGKSVQKQYETLFAHAADNPGFHVNEDCFLPELNFFNLARKSGMTFTEAFALSDEFGKHSQSKSAVCSNEDRSRMALLAKVAKHAPRARSYAERAVSALGLDMLPGELLNSPRPIHAGEFGHADWEPDKLF
jgi:MinD-like ATPase involved in chromosome partitioning or flagellar assembly